MIGDLIDDLDRYATIALCAISVALGIVQMYGLNQFQRLRQMAAIQVRFPTIVTTEARVLSLVLCVLIPITLVNRQWIREHERDSDIASSYWKHQEQCLDILSTWINPGMTYFLSHIEAMRMWLMYFQLKLLESLQNEEWGSKITSNYWRKDFYLKNRSKRGNEKWIVKRGFIYWITISSISGLSSWYLDKSMESIHYSIKIGVYLFKMILMLSPLGFIAYLYRKAPKTIKDRKDNMMIDEEFKMTCFVVAISVIGYVVSLILMALDLEFATFVTVILSWIFTMTAPSFVATLWIPRKIRKHKVLGLSNGPLILSSGLFKDHEFNPDGTRAESVLEEIQNLFLDKRKMRALARWMIRDCTMESFLAFVEMVQFKESIINVIKEQNVCFNERAVSQDRFKLYGHCPKSSIVFNNGMDLEEGGVVVEMKEIKKEVEERGKVVGGDHETENRAMTAKHGLAVAPYHVTVYNSASGNIPSAISGGEQCQDNSDRKVITLRAEDVHRFKDIAHLLFEKYVHKDAVWEINIGHDLKNRYYALDRENYASLQPLDWAQLNDEALKELWKYIMQSYGRMIGHLYCMEKEEAGTGV